MCPDQTCCDMNMQMNMTPHPQTLRTSILPLTLESLSMGVKCYGMSSPMNYVGSTDGPAFQLTVPSLRMFMSLSCVRLFCDPMDCSPPGFSVHGISQARTLD